MSTIRFLIIRSLLGAFCICLLAGCSLPWQSQPTPTAQQLLSAMQKNFHTVQTFHIQLQTQNTGLLSPGDAPWINAANGDVVIPDKVKAQATVIVMGNAVDVNLISIGKDQYVTDPITGKWGKVEGLIDPRILTNPDTGVLSLITKVHNLSVPTSDTANSVPCWLVQGQLASKELAFFTGNNAATTQLQVSTCIGKQDNLPYLVTVTGKAIPTDTDQTIRSFLLSNYNKPVTITAPQI
jgi:hypothetical protein